MTVSDKPRLAENHELPFSLAQISFSEMSGISAVHVNRRGQELRQLRLINLGEPRLASTPPM